MSAEDVLPCRWCGDQHGPLCPYVKALEFDPATSVVTRVEFLTPRDCVMRKEEEPTAERDYPRKRPSGG